VAARVASWHGAMPSAQELAWVLGKVHARVALIRHGGMVEAWGQAGRAEPPHRLGGDDGLRPFYRQPLHLGFATVDILNSPTAFYYFVLVCFALATAVMAFILRSPFGRTMLAIRENERRARFLGIPVELHIWIAFTLSCFFMAYAGSLYALVNNFADPKGLHYSQSGDFVMMAVLGGMRSFWGPLLGAIVFVVLQDYISSITINWQIYIGFLFVLVVLFFPRGLLGFIQQQQRRT